MTIDTATLPLPPHPPTPKDDEKGKGEKIRIGSTSGRSMTIGELKDDERDKLEGAMHGHFWVTVSPQGRLRSIPTYKELPDPVEDPMMQPFWRLPVRGVETRLRTISMQPMPSYSSPSIIIQHLCGYGYTAEEYVRNAKNLQRWGFICMRSQRDGSGQYYELWFLPFLLAARHELKDVIEASSKKEGSSFDKACHLEAAMSFLCRNATFGTLDACVQRAAMTIE